MGCGGKKGSGFWGNTNQEIEIFRFRHKGSGFSNGCVGDSGRRISGFQGRLGSACGHVYRLHSAYIGFRNRWTLPRLYRP